MIIHSVKKNKNGFSLIDVVMAVSVITVGLIGVMSLIVQNVQASRVNKDFLVASMLAQEGIELVRNIRDTNWLKMGTDWDDGFYDGTGNPYTFIIDKDGLLDDTVNLIDNAVLLLDDANNFYAHSGDRNTNFKRLITIEQPTVNPDYLIIKALVQWESSIGSTREYEVVSYLYNWR